MTIERSNGSSVEMTAPSAPPRFTRRAVARAAASGTALILAGAPPIRTGAIGPATSTPVASTPQAATRTFVLVHGTFFGGAGWQEVSTALQRAGHTVAAPDLPAHGDDRTPIKEVTLSSYVERLLGVVISEVAEQRPDKVGTLVYPAAYLLEDGRSLFDAGTTDTDSQLAPKLVVDQAAGVMTVPPEVFADTFLHDVPPTTAKRAVAQLRPEPLAPLVTPMYTTDAGFGRVRRVYVETLNDRAVSPALQKRMYTALPCERVLSMETGHCPFLARPDDLAVLLAGV